MAEAFGQNGHDITVYAVQGPEAGDPFVHYGLQRTFELRRVPLVGPRRRAAARALGGIVRGVYGDARPDVVYSRQVRYLLGCAPLGVPLVFEAHTMPQQPARLLARRALFALPNFARLVCISASLAEDQLAAAPELDPAKVCVAHDGAIPMPASLEPLVWPGRPGALQVGYVGGLYPGRGVDILLAIGAALPEVDVHIVGGRPEQVEALRADATPNVYFHGFVPHADVNRFYPYLDVLTAPYKQRVSVHGGGGDIRRWMSPLKVFEYMATGKAIVMTDVPVLREVLTHGETAWLIPDADPARWVEAVSALADDTERRLRLGEASRALFEAEYTWRRRAERVIAGLATHG